MVLCAWCVVVYAGCVVFVVCGRDCQMGARQFGDKGHVEECNSVKVHVQANTTPQLGPALRPS